MGQYDSSATSPGKVQSLTDYEKEADGPYRRWSSEITYSEKEASKYIDAARKVSKKYIDERDQIESLDRKFNLFNANVNLLKSALYAQLPEVEVRRRFSDPNDDIARVAALILKRNVEQDLDEPNNLFHEAVKNCIEDRLVPGMGIAWVRLNTETEKRTLEAETDPYTGEVTAEAMEYEAIVEQEVLVDYVHWEDFLWSPCRVYEERRWVARRLRFTRDELKEKFPEHGEKIPLDYNPQGTKMQDGLTPKNELFQQATVYEIWDRQAKKVIWLSKSYNKIIAEKEVFLQIEQFEPCPKPMFANLTTSNCIPKSDYAMIQDQYEELDTINNRISKLVEACKVVGVYDKSQEGVQRMFNEGVDNQLVPVDNWAMFGEKGGLKGVIDWLPLDVVVQALEKLKESREEIKQQLYELTGIADIVRGATKASETLGAQEIKAQFASIRIKRMQDEVSRFVCELLKIKAAIISKHFEPKIILQRANLEATEDIQYAEQAIQLIKNHAGSEWRISIQPDSMAQVDYAGKKKENLEMMNAVSVFFEKALPAIAQAPELAPFLLTLLKNIMASYKAGAVVESALDKTISAIEQRVKNPPPPQPDPAIIKVQAEVQKMREEMGLKQQEHMMNAQFKQREHVMDAQFKQQDHQMELAFKQQEHTQNLEQQQAEGFADMMTKLAQAKQNEQTKDRV